MRTGQNKYVLLMIPLLALMLALVLCTSGQQTNRTDVHSTTATWDLRGQSAGEGRYRVLGAVEYIPNALLTPQEFAMREDEALIGEPQEAAQYATSRMRILVPDDGYYTFARRSVDYAHKLYANGVLVSQTGTPGESRKTMTPNTGRVTVTLKAENGVIELIQQASVFVHRNGDSHAFWTIDKGENLRLELRWDLLDSIYMGCFLMLCFVHIILFLLLRTYRANLFFALFCFTWFVRAGVTGARVFTELAPWMPWELKFRLEYLAFPITAILLVSLMNEIFPGILQKGFRVLLNVWSWLFAVLCVLADTVLLSHAMLYCELLYLPAIAYILLRFALKMRSLNIGQCVFFAGVLLFLSTAVYDMLFYINIRIFDFSDLSQMSMLMLALCEAAAIFIATVQQIENAKAEEQRLALENAAIDRVSRMRGSMMATMGHEMRTPLTVMSVYAQLATEHLQELSVDEATTSDLKMISREAKRLADMATGLLTLGKEREYKSRFEVVDLCALSTQMAGLCQSMLDKNNNRLVLELDESRPLVCANTEECTQLLWNLLGNAARHTQDGTVTLGIVRMQDELRLTIADTGEGISPELLPTVFDRNVSGSAQRSGLGLCICKEIADAHNGTITIESPQAGGTVVTVTLPTLKEGIMHE